MFALTSRQATLSIDQFDCFLAMDADVRALCSDEWRADEVSDALLNALQERHLDRWRRLVLLICEVIAAAPRSAPRPARRRLLQFIAENSDLIVKS